MGPAVRRRRGGTGRPASTARQPASAPPALHLLLLLLASLFTNVQIGARALALALLHELATGVVGSTDLVRLPLLAQLSALLLESFVNVLVVHRMVPPGPGIAGRCR